ncbi:hypothetical protein CWE22_00755 [Pseudidiomarina aestuarii]|uniref:Uncharacterized protein n=1 Tax=Pseudidiomarina aestuarii TaxID=624146 RepID=A0A7Z6ZSV3_9GAMM|nr:hypothetical protein [Pseudidiomarina aestuarii]RUO40769.1 hypothetical protein CWE22_00755 [Pseudidiomarina aestuarii]
MSGSKIKTEQELAVALQRLGELSPNIVAQQTEYNQLLAAIDAYQSRFLTASEHSYADAEQASAAVQEGRLVDPEVVHGWMKKFDQSTKN